VEAKIIELPSSQMQKLLRMKHALESRGGKAEIVKEKAFQELMEDKTPKLILIEKDYARRIRG
jgi:hypothetical protein